MEKAMELTDRKKQILKIVVESYINTAEPVGSKAIVEQMPGKISSATIRNELADLVELGYLEQPHTSAGRVPSAKGYRLYVNELMERKALSAEETAKINDALSGQMKQVDQVISQAGQMVSSFVGYPTYAVADHRTAATVQRFELIAVDEGSFIAVVMLSDNRVKSQLMRLELPVDADTLPQLSHLLNTHFTGVGAEKMNATLMSLSEQLSPELFLVVSKAVEYAIGVLEQSAQRNVETAGASQILKMPEYRDVDKAHDLVTFLVDNKEELPVPDDGAPLKILIGPENVNEALKETSVVVASYDIGDGMRGLVGVVGPTRMDYATVTARLSYFADSLTRMFGKNELPPKEEDKE
jgi:heat-inducible transcriptional repressor